MHKNVLTDFSRGWFIGNFEPSLQKTEHCEVAVKQYQKGEIEQTHFHKIAHEYTLVLSGVFKLNDEILHENDLITLLPNEVSTFSCLESGKTLVVKLPSVKGDKYLI